MTPRRAPLDAVTFDYWNTLCYEPSEGYLRGLRIAAMREAVEEALGTDPLEELARAYDEAWSRYVRCWEANRQYTGADAARDIAATLGLSGRARAACVDAFSSVGYDADLDELAGVGDVLGGLVDAGVRVGIICDVGFTPSPVLRAHLDRHGLLHHFTHWSFSDEVGVYKPDGRIFAHALEGLGRIAPGRAAHVGDRRRTDMAGARGAGMRSVRITEVFDDDDEAQGPSGDVVVQGHAQLFAALGF